MSLPSPSTPLLGRHLEVVAVGRAARPRRRRLVTLTGPGGTGKTRLALAAAAELAQAPRPGSRLRRSRRAPRSRVAAGGDRAAARSGGVGALRRGRGGANVLSRRLLLVLDNLEQLLPEVTYLSRLLADAPGVRVLATSRAPLRLARRARVPGPAAATRRRGRAVRHARPGGRPVVRAADPTGSRRSARGSTASRSRSSSRPRRRAYCRSSRSFSASVARSTS